MRKDYQIKLREDGWFEAGKDAEHHCIRTVYSDLQQMKRTLDGIGPRKSMSALEKALKSVAVIPTGFGGRPYLSGKKIVLPSISMAHEVYIGNVVKVK